jgi:hypothetical protein
MAERNWNHSAVLCTLPPGSGRIVSLTDTDDHLYAETETGALYQILKDGHFVGVLWNDTARHDMVAESIMEKDCTGPDCPICKALASEEDAHG